MEDRPPFDHDARSFTVPHVDAITTPWSWLWPRPDDADGDGGQYSESTDDDGTPGAGGQEN